MLVWKRGGGVLLQSDWSDQQSCDGDVVWCEILNNRSKDNLTNSDQNPGRVGLVVWRDRVLLGLQQLHPHLPVMEEPPDRKAKRKTLGNTPKQLCGMTGIPQLGMVAPLVPSLGRAVDTLPASSSLHAQPGP